MLFPIFINSNSVKKKYKKKIEVEFNYKWIPTEYLQRFNSNLNNSKFKLIMNTNNNTPEITSAIDPKTQLSFGQKLVGVTFNLSKNPQVDEVEALYAKLADIVHEQYLGDYSVKGQMEQLVYAHTIGEILNAQMNTVKFLVTEFDQF